MKTKVQNGYLTFDHSTKRSLLENTTKHNINQSNGNKNKIIKNQIKKQRERMLISYIDTYNVKMIDDQDELLWWEIIHMYI